MPITVQYGPIAAALGLANVAGAGQGFNIQAQRDLQALQLQNSMQNSINSNDANLIQMAQAHDELQAKLAMQQQQNQQESVYRNAQQELNQQQLGQGQKRLEQQDSQFQAEQQTREQQAKSLQEQRGQALKDKQAHDLWLSGLTPDQQNIVNSGGHLPNDLDVQDAKRRQQSAQTEEAYKQATLYKEQIAIYQKQLDPLSGISDVDREGIQAKLNAAMKKYETTIDGINAATGSQAMTAGQNKPGGSPSAVLPDAEKAKLLLQMAAKLGLPPTDPRVIQAAAQAAPSYAASMVQAQGRAKQDAQVQAGSQRLQQQNVVNQQQYNQQQQKDQMWDSWGQHYADTPPF